MSLSPLSLPDQSPFADDIDYGFDEGALEYERSRGQVDVSKIYFTFELQQFDFGRFAAPPNLMRVFRLLKATCGQAPGIDGIRYSDFSPSEAFGVARRLGPDLERLAYVPSPLREVRIRKPSGGFRELLMAVLFDRVAAKALQLALDPAFRLLYPGWDRSVWTIFATLEKQMRVSGFRWLAVDDVRECYPSIRRSAAMVALERYVTRPDLLRLIELVLAGPTAPGTCTEGLMTGNAMSPSAAEVCLRTILDLLLIAARPGRPAPLRYVDNICVLVSDDSEAREVIETAEGLLNQESLHLKRDDVPFDLRDPQANRRILGLIPTWNKNRLSFRVPETGYERLAIRLRNAHLSKDPPSRMRQTLFGWTSWLGPVFATQNLPTTVDRIWSIACRSDCREVPKAELLQEAVVARQRWLDLRRSILGSVS